MSNGSKLWRKLCEACRGHLSKIIGAALSLTLIIIGSCGFTIGKVQECKHTETVSEEQEIIGYDGITRNKIHTSKNDGLSKSIIKLQIALEEKTDELKRILSEMENQLSQEKKDLFKLNKYLEKALEEEEIINTLIKDIKSQFNLEKKIATAHVFFKHVLKLIFILSGIIGLFWIAFWIARERREEREVDEQQKTMDGELTKVVFEKMLDKDVLKQILRIVGDEGNKTG